MEKGKLVERNKKAEHGRRIYLKAKEKANARSENRGNIKVEQECHNPVSSNDEKLESETVNLDQGNILSTHSVEPSEIKDEISDATHSPREPEKQNIFSCEELLSSDILKQADDDTSQKFVKAEVFHNKIKEFQNAILLRDENISKLTSALQNVIKHKEVLEKSFQIQTDGLVKEFNTLKKQLLDGQNAKKKMQLDRGDHGNVMEVKMNELESKIRECHVPDIRSYFSDSKASVYSSHVSLNDGQILNSTRYYLDHQTHSNVAPRHTGELLINPTPNNDAISPFCVVHKDALLKLCQFVSKLLAWQHRYSKSCRAEVDSIINLAPDKYLLRNGNISDTENPESVNLFFDDTQEYFDDFLDGSELLLYLHNSAEEKDIQKFEQLLEDKKTKYIERYKAERKELEKKIEELSKVILEQDGRLKRLAQECDHPVDMLNGQKTELKVSADATATSQSDEANKDSIIFELRHELEMANNRCKKFQKENSILRNHIANQEKVIIDLEKCWRQRCLQVNVDSSSVNVSSQQPLLVCAKPSMLEALALGDLEKAFLKDVDLSLLSAKLKVLCANHEAYKLDLLSSSKFQDSCDNKRQFLTQYVNLLEDECKHLYGCNAKLVEDLVRSRRDISNLNLLVDTHRNKPLNSVSRPLLEIKDNCANCASLSRTCDALRTKLKEFHFKWDYPNQQDIDSFFQTFNFLNKVLNEATMVTPDVPLESENQLENEKMINSLQTDLRTLCDKLQARESELEKLHAKLNGKCQIYHVQEQSIQGLQNQIQSEKIKFESLEAAAKKLENILKDKEEEKDILIQELTNLKTYIQGREEELVLKISTLESDKKVTELCLSHSQAEILNLQMKQEIYETKMFLEEQTRLTELKDCLSANVLREMTQLKLDIEAKYGAFITSVQKSLTEKTEQRIENIPSDGKPKLCQNNVRSADPPMEVPIGPASTEQLIQSLREELIEVHRQELEAVNNKWNREIHQLQHQWESKLHESRNWQDISIDEAVERVIGRISTEWKTLVKKVTYGLSSEMITQLKKLEDDWYRECKAEKQMLQKNIISLGKGSEQVKLNTEKAQEILEQRKILTTELSDLQTEVSGIINSVINNVETNLTALFDGVNNLIDKCEVNIQKSWQPAYHEMEAKHKKEMEELREYFENKVSQLERSYSLETMHLKSWERIRSADGLPENDLIMNSSGFGVERNEVNNLLLNLLADLGHFFALWESYGFSLVDKDNSPRKSDESNACPGRGPDEGLSPVTPSPIPSIEEMLNPTNEDIMNTTRESLQCIMDYINTGSASCNLDEHVMKLQSLVQNATRHLEISLQPLSPDSVHSDLMRPRSTLESFIRTNMSTYSNSPRSLKESPRKETIIQFQNNEIEMLQKFFIKIKTLLTSPPLDGLDRHEIQSKAQEIDASVTDIVCLFIKHVEDKRKETEDLQLQIEAADHQLKATRKFMEEQTSEREIEREEYATEVAKLKECVLQKDKEKSLEAGLHKELEVLELQLQEKGKLNDILQYKNNELETQLHATTEKIKDLRVIIEDLDRKLNLKTRSEEHLKSDLDKMKEALKQQLQREEELTLELCHLTGRDIKMDLRQHIQYLEKQLESQAQQLESYRQSQHLLTEMRAKIVHFEAKLDCKTRDFESQIQPFLASTASSPSTEELSYKSHLSASRANLGSSESIDMLPVSGEDFNRFEDKFEALCRVGDSAIGKIKELEVEIRHARRKLEDVRAERDVLQKQVTQQLLQVTEMKSHLDQQRHQIDPTQLQHRISYLTSEISQKNELIDAQSKELEVVKHELDEVRRLLVVRESEIHKHKLFGSSHFGKDSFLSNADEDLVSENKLLRKLIDDKNLELERAHNFALENLHQNSLGRDLDVEGRSLPTYFGEESYPYSSKQRPVSATAFVDSTTSGIESIREADIERSILEPTEAASRSRLKTQSPMFDEIYSPNKEENTAKSFPSVDELHSKIDVLMADIKSLEDLNNKLLEEAVERDAKIEAFKIQLQQKESRHAELEKMFQEMKQQSDDKVAGLTKEYKTVNEQNSQLINTLKNSLDELKTTLQEKDLKLSQLENVLKGKEDELQKAHGNTESIRQELSQTTATFEVKVKQLEVTKATLESSVAALSNDFKLLAGEKEEWSRQKEDLRLQLANSQVNCQNLMMEQKISEEHLLKVTEQEWTDKMCKLSRDLESRCAELESQNQKLKEEVSKLREGSLERQMVLKFSEDDSSSERDDTSDGDANRSSAKLEKLSKLMSKVHHDGMKVLTLSELLYIQKHSGDMSTKLSFCEENDEKKTMADTIRKLELTIDTRSHEHARQTGLLEYRIQQEKTISDDLRSALELEKKHVLDFMSQLSQERLKSNELEQQCTSLTGDVRDAESQLRKEKVNLELANKSLASEKTRCMHLETALKQTLDKVKELSVELEYEKKKTDVSNQNLKDLKTRLVEEQKNVMTVRNSIELLRSTPVERNGHYGDEKTTKEDSFISKESHDLLMKEREKAIQAWDLLAQERSQFSQDILKEKEKVAQLRSKEKDASNKCALLAIDVERLEKLNSNLNDINKKLSNEISALQKQSQEEKHQSEMEKRREYLEQKKLMQEKEETHSNWMAARTEIQKMNNENKMLRKELEMVTESRTELARKLSCASPMSTANQSQELNNLQLLLEEQFLNCKTLSDQVEKLLEERSRNAQKISSLEVEIQKWRERAEVLNDSDWCDGAASDKSWNRAPSLKAGSVNSQAMSDLKFGDDRENSIRYLYGKYLRVESYRKALIWQKKYLLLLLGGYQGTEKLTLRRLAQIGSFELSISTASSTPLRKFKSVAKLVIAVVRMKFLVRRWRSGKRIGASTMCYYANRNTLVVTSPYSETGSVSQGSVYLYPNTIPAGHNSGRSSVCSSGFSPPTRDYSSQRSPRKSRKSDFRDSKYKDDYTLSDSLSEYIKRFELIQDRFANKHKKY